MESVFYSTELYKHMNYFYVVTFKPCYYLLTVGVNVEDSGVLLWSASARPFIALEL
jgi:hypothetical protein